MDIGQISIYLKEGEERRGEISLIQPLEERTLHLSRPKRRTLGFSLLKDRIFSLFCSKPSAEAKFKTQLARLLSQEQIREHFLNDPEKRERFFKGLQEAAHQIGYTNFSKPDSCTSASEAAEFLTRLNGHCLLGNPKKLAFQARRMRSEEFPTMKAILEQIERSPVISGLEVCGSQGEMHISVATHYTKLSVSALETAGAVHYELLKNRVDTSQNQRIVLDTTNEKNPRWLGSYCGELGTASKVLEQVLLILQAKGEVRLSDETASLQIPILFTSLYNWREMEEICQQRDAIRSLDGKCLHIGNERITLRLFYYNLNSIYRLPVPAETRAFLEDLNDECIIRLLELEPFCERLKDLPRDFFERQKHILETIDTYRLNRSQMADPILDALVQKKINGRPLRGMDALLLLEEATQRLGVFHNKNCRNGIDRTSTAKAADKAQNAARKIVGESFLPGINHYKQLFRVLYSLYLLWEEPEMNATLTMGVWGSPFFKRLYYLNPQQEELLTNWAKNI